MWLAVGILAVVGLVRVFLEILFKAEVTWALPTLWLVTQLAASITVGALIGIHARRRLAALLAPIGGIALMLALASLEDHITVTRAIDPLTFACPLASLAACELVARLAPAARSGPGSTALLAASTLVGMILVFGIAGDEILRVPGWMIFAGVLAGGFLTGYLVQWLLATRQRGGCAAAPVFIVLHMFGSDAVASFGVLVGSIVLALLALWGAHRAWKRKLHLGVATEVQVPAARTTQASR